MFFFVIMTYQLEFILLLPFLGVALESMRCVFLHFHLDVLMFLKLMN